MHNAVSLLSYISRYYRNDYVVDGRKVVEDIRRKKVCVLCVENVRRMWRKKIFSTIDV
jgi:hypothetical protein